MSVLVDVGYGYTGQEMVSCRSSAFIREEWMTGGRESTGVADCCQSSKPELI
jgi:hypothetical protein